ncbi:MAG: TadE/TadG family type IV pilus assembly protein [Chloroflexota bacterium]|nr:TadE/TadG family type IV pilus assembly protein [Chloroflexota bacterium]
MEKPVQTERGQVLVIMVFGMIVLLVVAGLAIDGGTAILERRRMQNAADAGALAGTRQLAEAMCDGESSGATDLAVLAEVIDYGERNGVAGASGVVAAYVKFDGASVVGFSPPALVGGGTVPSGAAGVAVTTTFTRSTYFMSLVGINESAASAAATAVTGPPLYAGGLRPFGIPLDVVSLLNDGDCFTVSFENNCDQGDNCNIDYLDGQTSSHRGWMNLEYVWNQGEDPSDWPRALDHSGNASTLGVWMADGFNDHLIYADCFWDVGCRYGDHVHAKPGRNSSVIKHTPENELFHVPIFDEFPNCDGDPALLEAPYPDDRAQGGHACQGGQGADYYHIVGFAGVKIPPGGADQGGGTITACLEETIMGKGQPAPNPGFGTDTCATHTMVVTLWR